ncbi:hypothetical protein VPH35_124796 [Triticum aestivum]
MTPRCTFSCSLGRGRGTCSISPPPSSMPASKSPSSTPSGTSVVLLRRLHRASACCASPTANPTMRRAHRAYRAPLSAADAPVTCVLADSTIPFAFDIADELGIPSLAFVTHSASSYLAILSMPKLVELGETAFPADDLVRGVPGMEDFLRRRDLPRGLSCAEKGGEDPLVLKLAEVTVRSSKAHALIVNTAASMERSALAHIASCTSDVFAVGPLHVRSKFAASASLWREDDGCMAWLDGHDDRSVVYVSLGSLAVITHEQFTEFLAGLAATGYAFRWVLRPDMVQMAGSALLGETVEAVGGGRGRI